MNHTTLTNKVIIITGASAGIGRATAVALAQAGAHVSLVARRQERLQTLQAELAAHPGHRLIIAGDIGREGFAQEIINQTVDAFGKVDVLINNAGVGQRVPLAEMAPADMRRLIDTNVLGLLYLTQTAVARMKQQGTGHIINISSIVGQRPLPNMGLYCASKTAVNFISRSLRLELNTTNIHVSTVYPGRTQTEFGEALLGAPGSNPSAVGRVSAERVARVILKTIQTRKSEAYVTWPDWAFTQLNRLFPATTDWLVGKLVPRFRAK